MKQKQLLLFSSILLLAALFSCRKEGAEPSVKDPITIEAPVPERSITKVALTQEQQGYLQAGNRQAYRMLSELYEGKDLVFSPLSLQIALAMVEEGASGEVSEEILGALGYGDIGRDALREYCNLLLTGLPARDLDIDLRLADAVLVNDRFTVRDRFKETVETSYYAPVENMDFTDPQRVLDRINDWARRHTNGFIPEILKDVSPMTVAYLMNALYFRAKWSNPFDEKYTREDTFHTPSGETRVEMMHDRSHYRYEDKGDYHVVTLPYGNGAFLFTILLPKENDGLDAMLEAMTAEPPVSFGFYHHEVILTLPKFETYSELDLEKMLRALGMRKAFEFSDDFQELLEPVADGLYYQFCISHVLQNARIRVEEGGTEAAAVTVVSLDAATDAGTGHEPPKPVVFTADHPFVYLITESSSGAILFSGIFTGE